MNKADLLSKMLSGEHFVHSANGQNTISKEQLDNALAGGKVKVVKMRQSDYEEHLSKKKDKVEEFQYFFPGGGMAYGCGNWGYPVGLYSSYYDWYPSTYYSGCVYLTPPNGGAKLNCPGSYFVPQDNANGRWALYNGKWFYITP